MLVIIAIIATLVIVAPITWFISGKVIQKANDAKIGNANERAREIYGYSKAWMHHKGRNKHHFEYWTDYSNETHQLEPVEMPLKYVKEMFCDRVAASKIYGGKNYNDSYALNYYNKRKDCRRIHPKTAEKIEFLLTMLSEKGEKETFKYIRKMK